MTRVLVVDDDYHVAHAHALGVERTEGFTVAGEAHTCAEALDLVARERPNLVLLDMYLPDGSGLDVMRRLAADEDDPPDVVAVTAARDIDTVRTAMQLGAFYYLVKPFPMRALREQLEAYRVWSERLHRTPPADQDLVDDLFSLRAGRSRRTPTTTFLPPTMARVLDIVASAPQSIGSTEVAEILGASRPTAQRYLATLLRRQLVELELSYGSTGRPEHRYRRTERPPR